MAIIAPPTNPPRVAEYDDDGRRRLYSRLRIWSWTALTVIVTGWLCTYGLFAAILALAVAKHVLVAILAMEIGVDSHETADVPGA